MLAFITHSIALDSTEVKADFEAILIIPSICGREDVTFDITGMSFEEIGELVAFVDWLMCEAPPHWTPLP